MFELSPFDSVFVALGPVLPHYKAVGESRAYIEVYQKVLLKSPSVVTVFREKLAIIEAFIKI